MSEACRIYALWLEDSTQVTSKDLVRQMFFMRVLSMHGHVRVIGVGSRFFFASWEHCTCNCRIRV